MLLGPPEQSPNEVAPLLGVVRPAGQLLQVVFTGVLPVEYEPVGQTAHPSPPDPAEQTAMDGLASHARARVLNAGVPACYHKGMQQALSPCMCR